MENITWDKIVSTAPDIIKDILDYLKTNRENPTYHPESSTYNHIKIVTERLIKTGDMDLVMAGFMHDIGKASVIEKSNDGDWNTSHGHEAISAKLVLRYKDWVEEMGANPYVVHEIVKNHDKIKFNAFKKKDKEKLERHGVYPKLITFTDADNMNRQWDLDEGLVNVTPKKYPTKIEGDYPDGEWEKGEFDRNGNMVFFERSGGYWGKWEYENGDQIYYEDSNGIIRDNRNQVNESLVNVTPKKYNQRKLVWKIYETIEKYYTYTEIDDNRSEPDFYTEDDLKLYLDVTIGDFVVWVTWINEIDKKNLLYVEIRNTATDEDVYNGKVVLTGGKSSESANDVMGIINKYTQVRDLPINEGLVNVKSKKDRIEYKGDFPDGYWTKREYDQSGNQLSWENSNGEWAKWVYDRNGNEIYWENGIGDWYKMEYDENGNVIYSENSEGDIVDNRHQVNEGLVNVTRKLKLKDAKVGDYLMKIINDGDSYWFTYGEKYEIINTDDENNITVEDNHGYDYELTDLGYTADEIPFYDYWKIIKNELNESLVNVKRKKLQSGLETYIFMLYGILTEEYKNHEPTLYRDDEGGQVEMDLEISFGNIYVELTWSNDPDWKDEVQLKITTIGENGEHLLDMFYGGIDTEDKQVNELANEIIEIINNHLS